MTTVMSWRTQAIPSEQWASKVLAILDDNNLGVLVSVRRIGRLRVQTCCSRRLLQVSSLILGLISHSPKGYEEVVSKATRILNMVRRGLMCELLFSKLRHSLSSSTT